MTIRLGFLHRVKDLKDPKRDRKDVGTASSLPKDSMIDPKTGKTLAYYVDYASRERVARQQLAAIQDFMDIIGAFFAVKEREAGRPIDAIDQYVHAEAKALSLGPEAKAPALCPSTLTVKRPYPTLKVDLKNARRERGGRKPSWAFERLFDLFSSPETLDVWYTAQGFPVLRGQSGSMTWKRPFDDKSWSDPYGPPSGQNHFFVLIRFDNPDETTKKREGDLLSSKNIGETIVHELVIHGWRAIQESENKATSSVRASPVWAAKESYLKWKALYDYIWGGHAHGAHTGPSMGHGKLGSPEHSLADIEADLLHYYLEKEPPKRVAGDEGRPHEDKEFLRLIHAIGGATLMCETYCKAEGRKILGHSSSIPAKFR
jgi:hypothetical protein